ncbi:MAG TPA: carbonic anhydrase [Methylomirabilota bacterium]|nr:carbonic anhydrase [Methylomirabilota bacterium]
MGAHEILDDRGRRRREFLRVGVLGVGASLLAPALLQSEARAAAVDALLLSCMDYRLIAETERYMSGRGLRHKYDHVILAGGALGALTEKYPAWNQTFWQHLDVAIQLHQVHKVIVLDHRDCGAYQVILGEDFAKDRAKETTVHAEQLQNLRKRIVAQYPSLQVELLLMSLDGKVEKVS